VLRSGDASDAQTFKAVVLRRLRDIDLRINGTLAMLRDFPDLELQTRPIAVEFWQEYRKANTPEVTDEDVMTVGGGQSKNERLIELYKEEYDKLHNVNKIESVIPIDMNAKKNEIVSETTERSIELHVEIEPIVAEPDDESAPSFARHEALVQHEPSNYHDGVSASSRLFGYSHAMLLMVVGATAIVAIIAMLFTRRRRHNRHPGFIEVDICTPEEKHVAGMQVTGYENPTYSFFDKA